MRPEWGEANTSGAAMPGLGRAMLNAIASSPSPESLRRSTGRAGAIGSQAFMPPYSRCLSAGQTRSVSGRMAGPVSARTKVHAGFTSIALDSPLRLRQFGPPMPRILLAEDDDSLRGFLARALERAVYGVTACADGEEAAAVLDEAWDLLLTDIVMPGMDGIEVARLAAARHPGLRIMFITGFAAVALSSGDRAIAGAKVLSKPIHLREIVAEVERMMAA